MGMGKFLLELTKMFSMYRWNTRPSLIKFTEADNAYHGLVLSLFSVCSQESSRATRFLQKRIVKEFPKIVLSDISLDTKNRIILKNSSVWDKVLQSTYCDLKLIIDDETINSAIFMEDSLSHEDSKKSALISLLVALGEVQLNRKVFPQYYSQSYEELKEKLQLMDYIGKDELIELSESLFHTTLRLNTIIRWNNNHRNVISSVASHSFFVTASTLFLTIIYGCDENTAYKALAAAILHDLPEAFTGDVITPTKKKVEGLEEIISEIENDFIDEWKGSNSLIKEKMDCLQDFMINPFASDYGRIVKNSDILAAMTECAVEIKTGNQNEIFRKAFFSSKKELKKYSVTDISDILDEIEYLTFF